MTDSLNTFHKNRWNKLPPQTAKRKVLPSPSIVPGRPGRGEDHLRGPEHAASGGAAQVPGDGVEDLLPLRHRVHPPAEALRRTGHQGAAVLDGREYTHVIR